MELQNLSQTREPTGCLQQPAPGQALNLPLAPPLWPSLCHLLPFPRHGIGRHCSACKSTHGELFKENLTNLSSSHSSRSLLIPSPANQTKPRLPCLAQHPAPPRCPQAAPLAANFCLPSLLVTPTSHSLLLLLSRPWLFLAVPEQAQGAWSCWPQHLRSHTGKALLVSSTFLRSEGCLLSAVNKRKCPSPAVTPSPALLFWPLLRFDTHNDCV